MGLDVTYKFEYSSTVPYPRDQLLFSEPTISDEQLDDE